MHEIVNSIEQAVPEQAAEAITSSGNISISEITSSGITAPGAVKEREVAYIIKDPHFEDFPIYKSANAWWMDKTKVDRLIEAFKQGHLVQTAKFYAGISTRQWQYFNEIHPDFCELIEEIEAHPLYIKAMNSVVGGLDSDPKLSMALLRARHPLFRKQSKVEQILPPVVQQTVQVAVSQNVDTTRIASIIEEAANAIIAGKRAGESPSPQGD